MSYSVVVLTIGQQQEQTAGNIFQCPTNLYVHLTFSGTEMDPTSSCMDILSEKNNLLIKSKLTQQENEVKVESVEACVKGMSEERADTNPFSAFFVTASDQSNITLVELDSFHQNYGIPLEFELIPVGKHDTT
ncbi:hypothetical protein ACLOJK_028758 [Asimina triloba]